MPKIRFNNLPASVWRHLLQRVNEREIPLAELQRLQAWVQTGPTAPDGDWYKDFGSFKICGNGELPKTVLNRDMEPFGNEID